MADKTKKKGLAEVFVIEAINHIWRAGIKPGKEVSFHPDPGVFMTEAEAQFYCAKHSDKLCTYTYRSARIGHFSRQFMLAAAEEKPWLTADQ